MHCFECMMGTRTQIRFISTLAAILVTGLFFSSSPASASPVYKDKPKDKFAALTYADLRPRLLIRAEGPAIASVVRDPTYIQTSTEGYQAELAYTEGLLTYPAKQLFRIVYATRSEDYVLSGTQMESTGFNLIRLTVQPVGPDLKAVGEPIDLATKAKLGDKVKEFVGYNEERVSRLASLSYNRARVGDILLNVLDYRAAEGVIPGGSRSQVIRVEKEWRQWTFVSNYHLIVRVSPCPASLRDNNCEARLQNYSSYPDHRFGHWVHPNNVRSWQIWGITVVY